MNHPRPSEVFDTGLQHERTSLVWERTAISMMVAGLVLSRFAATEAFWLLAAGGMVQVVFGAVLLVWSGVHYEELHGTLRRGIDVVHPSATRWVGLATIAGTGAGLVAAIVVAIARRPRSSGPAVEIFHRLGLSPLDWLCPTAHGGAQEIPN